MIWIYEHLSAKESNFLRQHEPFMDIDFNIGFGGGIVYRTFCAGYEIRNGKIEEIRKARFFGLDNVKQGFITDDIRDAMLLCYSIRGRNQLDIFADSDEKWQEVLQYFEAHNSRLPAMIAVTVRAFIEYYCVASPKALDLLDVDLLAEWKIDVYQYIGKGKRWF